MPAHAIHTRLRSHASVDVRDTKASFVSFQSVIPRPVSRGRTRQLHAERASQFGNLVATCSAETVQPRRQWKRQVALTMGRVRMRLDHAYLDPLASTDTSPSVGNVMKEPTFDKFRAIVEALSLVQLETAVMPSIAATAIEALRRPDGNCAPLECVNDAFLLRASASILPVTCDGSVGGPEILGMRLSRFLSDFRPRMAPEAPCLRLPTSPLSYRTSRFVAVPSLNASIMSSF